MTDTLIAPDPSETTTPDPVANTDTAVGEWDHLDTPTESGLPDDPMEFRDDLEAKEAEGAEGDGEGDETDTETTPETDPETVTPNDEADTPEIEALQKKAEEFEYFDNLLKQNPVGLVTAVVDTMTPAEKAALIQQLGGTAPAQSDFDINAYEPQGEMEAALAQQWQHIQSIPEIAKEIPAIKASVQQATEQLTPHISQANVIAEQVAAKVDALCQALGIDLADADLTAVSKALQGGKSYRDAVRGAVNYQKAVEAAKQRSAPRPKTPGNGTRQMEPFPERTDAVTIARRLGTLR